MPCLCKIRQNSFKNKRNVLIFFLKCLFFHINIHVRNLDVILISLLSIIACIWHQILPFLPKYFKRFFPFFFSLLPPQHGRQPSAPSCMAINASLLVSCPIYSPLWQRGFFCNENLGTSLLCLHTIVVPHRLPNKPKSRPWSQ